MSTLKTNNIQHVDRSDPSIIINTDGGVSIAGTLTYEDVTNVDAVGIVTGRELINAQKQIHVGTGVSVKAGGLNVTAGITTVQALQATTGTFSGAVSGTTGTFSGVIKIPDGSTSAPSLAASSDTNSGLYFAGADALGLVVGGSRKLLANSSGITINNGDLTIDDKIIHQADTNTAIRFPAADTVTVETSGSERLRIDSSGRVIIGATSVSPANSYSDNLVVSEASGNVGMQFVGNNSNSNYASLYFGDAGGSQRAFFEAQLGANGNFTIGTAGSGAIRFNNSGGEKLRIDSSGRLMLGTTTEGYVSADDLTIATSGNTGITLRSGTGNLGTIAFSDATSGTGEYQGYIQYAQDTNYMDFSVDAGTKVALKINAESNATFSGIATATEFVATNIQTSGRKNLIINGGHSIAQRGTAAVTVTTSAKYRSVDRYKTDIDGSGGGDFSHEQSTDVPTGQGFRHSSKFTVVTQASQPTSESVHHQIYQMLEKQDVYHLEWGTSNAKTCTISFWVKSSITGTHAFWFAFYGGSNYYYWTNYTISSANTWEKKTITVTGPTSGGNVTADSATNGFRVEWTLGAGSDSETGTLNTWVTSGTFRTASGTVYLPENAGATFYLTGVQFEVGSNASAFEFRSFAEELALCQRYYEAVYMTDGTAAMPSYDSYGGTTNFEYQFKVEKRATPTWSLEGNASWSGATPNAFESRSACVFQHNSGTLFRLSDGAGDLCGSFDAEL